MFFGDIRTRTIILVHLGFDVVLGVVPLCLCEYKCVCVRVWLSVCCICVMMALTMTVLTITRYGFIYNIDDELYNLKPWSHKCILRLTDVSMDICVSVDVCVSVCVCLSVPLCVCKYLFIWNDCAYVSFWCVFLFTLLSLLSAKLQSTNMEIGNLCDKKKKRIIKRTLHLLYAFVLEYNAGVERFWPSLLLCAICIGMCV